jgi:tungstate transport system substrate-binding protein
MSGRARRCAGKPPAARRVIRRRAALFVLAAGVMTACGRAPAAVVLATTTSVDDSGLLDSLLVAYRGATSARVRPIAVGSGEALELGRRGGVDVILAHSPADELAFMAAGHGVSRAPVFASDFVVVGPPADPAAIARAGDATAAFARIAAAGALFISRGDGSGTHRREQQLWRRAVQEAGIVVPPDGLVEAGLGMAGALQLASARGAYTLADRASFALLGPRLNLAILFEGDDALVNEYNVIVVRGARHGAAAAAFAQWLRSDAARARVASFGAAHTPAPFRPVP